MNRISPVELTLNLYDAHLHLTDPRFSKNLPDILQTMAAKGIRGCVTNATGEHDWNEVLNLASAYPWVRPAIGVHPWWTASLGQDWYQHWIDLLDSHPGCLIGEIGLDLAMREPDINKQRLAFRLQIKAAAERQIPASIHCVRAWNELYEDLKPFLPLASGFLLHSFNGPSESVPKWAEAGAYFSISAEGAASLSPSRIHQLRKIPIGRLLIETDAPNSPPPDEWTNHPLLDPSTGKRLNHPANLPSLLIWISQILETNPQELGSQIALNYHTLFGETARIHPSQHPHKK